MVRVAIRGSGRSLRRGTYTSTKLSPERLSGESAPPGTYTGRVSLSGKPSKVNETSASTFPARSISRVPSASIRICFAEILPFSLRYLDLTDWSSLRPEVLLMPASAYSLEKSPLSSTLLEKLISAISISPYSVRYLFQPVKERLYSSGIARLNFTDSIRSAGENLLPPCPMTE